MMLLLVAAVAATDSQHDYRVKRKRWINEKNDKMISFRPHF